MKFARRDIKGKRESGFGFCSLKVRMLLFSKKKLFKLRIRKLILLEQSKTVVKKKDAHELRDTYTHSFRYFQFTIWKNRSIFTQAVLWKKNQQIEKYCFDEFFSF